MSDDDLVKRLREHINSIPVRNIQGRTFHGWEPDTLIEQAADRIEKLEAALREIANGQRDADKSYAELLAEVRIEARKALEGEIMESETGPSPKLNVEYYAILYWQERYEKSKKRIEKLEGALREIAAGYETPWSTSTVSNMLNVAEILSDRINIARKALEGENG